MLNNKHARLERWQLAMADLVSDPAELLALLNLDEALLPAAKQAVNAFPLRVPRSFVRRMTPGNPGDPLLRQVLPIGAELAVQAGYSEDPLGEQDANPITGLLHKYHDRVLVTLTSACAVHCRYCFRRHFPYADNNPGTAGWDELIGYINCHPNINEVILSGGDPLTVPDRLLAKFIARIEAISHVTRLRIHSRTPIVLPERITDDFVSILSGSSFDVVLVVHANHAQELDEHVQEAMHKLRNANILLLNQAVLLRGVNDNVDALAGLSRQLFAIGVLPYYLHVLDKVQGAAHFDLPLSKAKALHAELTARLSGYLVPRLVREEAGKPSKTPL